MTPRVRLLVNGQRTKGIEIGASGTPAAAWHIMAAYSYQDGFITRTLSASALAGAQLAQLPRHTFSIWNRVDFSRVWAAGLGIVRRGDMFASTDNAVSIPSFVRVDAAVFANLSSRVRAQLNVENAVERALLRVCAQQLQHHARLAACRARDGDDAVLDIRLQAAGCSLQTRGCGPVWPRVLDGAGGPLPHHVQIDRRVLKRHAQRIHLDRERHGDVQRRHRCTGVSMLEVQPDPSPGHLEAPLVRPGCGARPQAPGGIAETRPGSPPSRNPERSPTVRR